VFNWTRLKRVIPAILFAFQDAGGVTKEFFQLLVEKVARGCIRTHLHYLIDTTAVV
jgi:hypothetical protein